MIPVFIDLETYYSPTHSLTKMSPLAYCMHPDTEVISIAIKVGKYPTDVIVGEDKVKHALSRIDWSNKMVIGHNLSGFDGMILAWRLGVKPKAWGCTLAMARPFFAKTVGVSLKAVAKELGLGDKLDFDAVNAKGKHLCDFTPEELAKMEAYNRTDTELCAGIFNALAPKLGVKELNLIDMTIRMLLEPAFVLDYDMLEDALVAEKRRKFEALMRIKDMLGVEDEEAARAMLASAPKFRAFLESQGVPVPMKISKTTGLPTTALAKTDEDFLALQEHDNELVAAAAEARLGVKSTILETRIEAFITAGDAVNGLLPVPLHWAGADTTWRWSGWAYNPQNLPRIDPSRPKPGDALRKSMRAPKGYKVIVADLSGIELRVNHFLWQVPSSMQLYQQSPDKADLYKEFASVLYMVAREAVSKEQRQVGKVCVAEGSLVLTDKGLVPIEQVTSRHRVWDGVEWVYTLGAIYQGEKEVITYDSVTATPDHIVYLQSGEAVELQVAAEKGLSIARTGDAERPVSVSEGFINYDLQRQAQQPDAESSVRGVWGSQADRYAQPEARHDQGVPEMQPAEAGTQVAGSASNGYEAAVREPERQELEELRWAGDSVQVRQCTGSLPLGKSKLGVAQGHGAGQNGQQRQLRTGEPALGIPQDKHLEPAKQQDAFVCAVSATAPGDTLRRQHVAQSSPQGVDVRADRSEVLPEVSKTKRRVWDILNAGPRRRFTVANKLVSNCHLGLGFGAGAATFVKVAKLMGGVDMTLDEAKTVVFKWRQAYREIAQGWRTCHESLEFVHDGRERAIDPWGLCLTCKQGIILNTGHNHIIRYPGLHEEVSDDNKAEWWYGQGRKRARIYAGKVDENLVQALARDVIADSALEFKKRTGLLPKLMVHDELVYVVPERHAESMLAELQAIMRTPPTWWPELVTWSEGDIADTYGDAK